MYRKSEKDISVIASTKANSKTKSRNIFNLLVFVLLIGPLFGQIDNRFNIFSWEQYGGVGAVNSISEDYSYFYFGTENAGILRLNKLKD